MTGCISCIVVKHPTRGPPRKGFGWVPTPAVDKMASSLLRSGTCEINAERQILKQTIVLRTRGADPGALCNAVNVILPWPIFGLVKAPESLCGLHELQKAKDQGPVHAVREKGLNANMFQPRGWTLRRHPARKLQQATHHRTILATPDPGKIQRRLPQRECTAPGEAVLQFRRALPIAERRNTQRTDHIQAGAFNQATTRPIPRRLSYGPPNIAGASMPMSQPSFYPAGGDPGQWAPGYPPASTSGSMCTHRNKGYTRGPGLSAFARPVVRALVARISMAFRFTSAPLWNARTALLLAFVLSNIQDGTLNVAAVAEAASCCEILAREKAVPEPEFDSNLS
ncbi:hypothetical protein DFH07DRAFT_773671 [Mycena maculata]|uniref:Uncharacterized protein n=1 Tax=Mycena maculata TaxID=230809 RepID=A0AAD7J554_9AGAR|nr:hypothetical protein DFH07DRAFT_773671 [Mycena maculata]